MVGAWEGQDDGATVEEHWTSERGGTMMGVNRVIADDETVFFEFLQIESTAEGVVYRAWPKAASGTTFRMTSRTDQSVTFENPSHDFPKVITYWKEGDKLRARARGVEDGKPRTSEWVWRKTP